MVLQEDAAKLEMEIHKWKAYISKGAWIRSKLQWIKEGHKGFKFCVDFLKRKVVDNKVLGLFRDNVSLVEDPIKVEGMFGLHFQNIFSPYALVDHAVGAKNCCYKVILHKLCVGDQDRLDNDFSKEELFAVLSSL